METKFFLKFFIFLPLLFVLFFPSTSRAADATIQLTPSTGTYLVGDDVPLSVVVNSGGKLVNAVSARITYNPSDVTITRVTRDASLISSWTQQPSINAEIGEVDFGGTLATGTALANGLILTLHATPLHAGEMYLRFENEAAVEDGSGGNILTGFQSGKYRVSPKELADPPSPEVTEATGTTGEVLGAATGTPPVIITSPTHPNQEAWYSASTSLFVFQYPDKITKLRLGFDQKSEPSGRLQAASLDGTKEIGNLANGTWFLHAIATIPGGAEATMRYQIHVDRTLPEGLSVEEIPRTSTTDPAVMLKVTATDTMSGIDHYEFAIDGGASMRWNEVSEGRFKHKFDKPGSHIVTAIAFDKAGNFVKKDISCDVTFLPPPQLELKEKNPIEGDALAILVHGPASATIDFALSRGLDSPLTEHTTLDASGVGEFTSALRLSPGEYGVTARATAVSGGVSEDSARLSVTVSSSIFGILSRHPLIPIALLLLVFMGVVGIFIFWKIRSRESREADVPPPFRETFNRESPTLPREFPSRDAPLDALEREEEPGQVILRPRVKARPQIQATRL